MQVHVNVGSRFRQVIVGDYGEGIAPHLEFRWIETGGIDGLPTGIEVIATHPIEAIEELICRLQALVQEREKMKQAFLDRING